MTAESEQYASLNVPLLTAAASKQLDIEFGGEKQQAPPSCSSFAALPYPYYVRFRLTSERCDDFFAWSVAIGRPSNLDQWTNIMRQLRPIVLQLEQCEATHLRMVRWSVITFITTLVVVDQLPDFFPYNGEEIGHIASICLGLSIGMAMVSLAAREAATRRLVAIMNATCQFSPLGKTLKCKLVANELDRRTLYVYVLQTNTVFREVVVNKGFWHGPVNKVPSFGAAFDPWLPRKEQEALQSAIKLPPRQRIQLWLPPTLAFLAAWELTKNMCYRKEDYAPCIFFRALACAIVFGVVRLLFAAHHYHSGISAQKALVQEYATKWASRGIYLELRRVWSGHPVDGHRLVEEHVLFIAHRDAAAGGGATSDDRIDAEARGQQAVVEWAEATGMRERRTILVV